MTTIYIIEDDETMRSELKTLLEKYGYLCLGGNEFEHVVEDILRTAPQLVLLDINLPVFDGYHICRQLRKHTNIPIIMVTSRNSDVDELISMNLGADDFITKPYNTQILLARIASLLRRAYPNNTPSTVLTYKGVVLDLLKSTIRYAGQEMELTKNELRILHQLMAHPGVISSRDDLMNALWQSDEFVDDNTLTVNINRLRRKLSAIGVNDLLVTKRGQGYRV